MGYYFNSSLFVLVSVSATLLAQMSHFTQISVACLSPYFSVSPYSMYYARRLKLEYYMKAFVLLNSWPSTNRTMFLMFKSLLEIEIVTSYIRFAMRYSSFAVCRLPITRPVRPFCKIGNATCNYSLRFFFIILYSFFHYFLTFHL